MVPGYENTWRVEEGWGVSDHNCIVIDVNIRKSKSHADRGISRTGWKHRGADWEGFLNEMRLISDIHNMHNNNTNAQLQVNTVTKIICESADTILGPKKPSKRNTNRWWNSRLNNLRKWLVQEYKNQILEAKENAWR